MAALSTATADAPHASLAVIPDQHSSPGGLTEIVNHEAGRQSRQLPVAERRRTVT
jgi:hypothetical protein